MARTKAGLTEPEIAELREQLAAGRRPRVQLSGPHFPVEATGTVVRIGSPEIDGPDYLRVRVKVNGMTDELAFEPNELRRRSARARKATAKAAGRGTRTGSRPAKAAQPAKAAAQLAKPAQPAKAAAQPVKSAAQPAKSAVQPAKSAAAAAQPRRASSPADAAHAIQPGKPAEQPSQPATDAAQQLKPGPARRRKPGSAPKVSFTVSSSGASWTVAATRGNKALVRNVGLPPGVVSALAELLGQPALAEAVSEINDAALAEARARAEQLRAELDQLEAVLATHRRP